MNYIKMSPIAGMSGYGGGATALPFSAASVAKWEGNIGIDAGGTSYSKGFLMNKWNIASTGNAIDWGDLTVSRRLCSACAGEGRGITGSGNYIGNKSDVLDHYVFATAGDATDFGDLTVARQDTGAASDGVKGVWVGGETTEKVNTMDYVTIANTGNASDFGDYAFEGHSIGCLADATRGIGFGGTDENGTSSAIHYWTFASLGNTSSFGTLDDARRYAAGCSNLTKGLIAGGHAGMTDMEQITIQTAGNGSDFGDLTTGRRMLGSCGSSEEDRACWSGGENNSTGNSYNVIDYTSFSSPGNASDFGDLVDNRHSHAACSGD